MNTQQPTTHSHNLTNEQRLAFTDAVVAGMPFREALVLAHISEPLSRAAETELEAITQTVEVFADVKHAIVPRREGLERVLAELAVTTPAVVSSASVPSPFMPSFLTGPGRTPDIFSRFLVPVGAPLFAFLMVATILLSADHSVPVLSPSSLSLVPTSEMLESEGTPPRAMLRSAPQDVTSPAPQDAQPMMMAMMSAPSAPEVLDTVDAVEEFVLREAEMELALVDADLARAPRHTSNVDLFEKLSLAYDAIDR